MFLFFKPVKIALDALFAAAEEFGDILLDFREHSDSVGGVRRKLPEVVRAVGVALDDLGTVGGCGNVPTHIADLRSYLCGFKHHLYSLTYIRDSVALQVNVGFGVLLINYALYGVARMSRIKDFSRFGIYGSEQTVVVDNAAADSHFLHDIEHMGLTLAVEHGDDPHAVNGVGIKPCNVGVLGDVVLEDAELLVGEIFIKLVKAFVIAYFNALAAVAAFEILHFAEDVFALFAELLNLFPACLLKLNKAAAHAVFIKLVELVLVFEEVVVVVIVHKGVELFAYKARNIG